MKFKSTSKAIEKALRAELSWFGSAATFLGILAALSILMAGLCPATAAEPLVWERTPNRPAPAQFDTYHGESLDFRCTFTGFGALPFAGGDAPRLFYQTNGMGAAWWSIPATVSTTIITNSQPSTTNYALAATFTPDLDPGAERLTVFFGAPSNAYAAAQVRFRNSPGPHPNDLDPPSVLDWQAELSAATNALSIDLMAELSASTNALWTFSAAAFMPQTNAYTKAETDSRIIELSPPTSLAPATNYTDQLRADLSNGDQIVESARLAESADFTRYAYNLEGAQEDRSANTIFSQIDSKTTTNDVCAIVTNEVVDFECSPSEYNGEPISIVLVEYGNYQAYRPAIGGRVIEDSQGYTDLSSTNLVWREGENWIFEFTLVATGKKRNALGLARLSDIPSTNGLISAATATNIAERSVESATNSIAKSFAPTISNTVTKTYVESLGIEAGTSYGCTILRFEDGSMTNVTWSGTISMQDLIAAGIVQPTLPYAFIKPPVAIYGGESVTGIGTGIFEGCPKLETVSFPFVTNVGIMAFASCDSLSSIDFPMVSKLVNQSTFSECTSLKSINMPSLKVLGDDAFYGCTALESVSFPKLDEITAGGNEGGPFVECTNLKVVYVPCLTNIADSAFYGCTSLTEVNFGNSLTNVTALGRFVFEGTPSTLRFIVPDALYDDWIEYVVYWGDYISQILRYSDWQYVRQYELDSFASTTYVDTATNTLSTSFAHTIATADTTYRRTIGITNLNQTVQFVNITDTAPTTLSISMPTNGVTKDWIVYVSAITNVTLSLPSATWWMADIAFTNDVPPATPTAFYFSQIFSEGTTNVFYLSRQELTPVTITEGD